LRSATARRVASSPTRRQRGRWAAGGAAVGTQSAEVEQRAYFRTAGLPGLSWVPRLGDQLEPYLAGRYPADGRPLYRREPIAIAFTEGFNTLVPVGHGPANQTPERQQQLAWTLAVERAAATDVDPVTETADDWLTAHAVPGAGEVRLRFTLVRTVIRRRPAMPMPSTRTARPSSSGSLHSLALPVMNRALFLS